MELSKQEKARAQGRKYYHAHKERYKEYRRKQRKARRQLVQKFKRKPCTDCGVKYPYYVMDFDHVRGEKLFLISAMASMKVAYNGKKTGVPRKSFSSGMNVGLDRLLTEIAKCDVVCSNCHRIRTHKRRLKTNREKRNNTKND